MIGPSIANDFSGIEALPIFGNQLRGIASGGAITGGVTRASEVSSAAVRGLMHPACSGSAAFNAPR